MSVRKKILVPMLILTVVCAAAIFASSVWLFNRNIEDAAYNRIQYAALEAQYHLEHFKTNSNMAAKILADDIRLAEALKKNDRLEILAAAEELLRDIQVDFCTILDSEGTVIVRTHEPDNYGQDLSYQHNITHAMKGNVMSTVERGSAVRLSARTGAPVIDENDDIIGVVSVGYRFDTPDFAATLKEITNCDVTFFLDNERISTTIEDPYKEIAIGTVAIGKTAETLQQVYTGKPHYEKMNLQGSNIIAAFVPIAGTDDEVVGALAIAGYLDDEEGRLRTFIIGSLVAFAVVLIIAITVAVLISNSIDRKIHTMMARIHESEKLEMELEREQNSNKLKTSFLANMSHEIRTPMNVILGLTETSLRDESITDEMREGLEKIYDSGKMLLNIVNDILDHSKIEAGRLEIKSVEYSLPRLINDAVQQGRLRYENKSLDFILDVSADLPLTLLGDEMRIRQVLNNIISNAYKYTDTGSIKMAVNVDTAETGSDKNDVMLNITISDTGLGMTKEQTDRLFTEYMRFNAEADREAIGTGLGLSVSKHIIELMGGAIAVSSTPGEGSVFKVSLPQKKIGNFAFGEDVAARLRSLKYRDTEIVRVEKVKCEPMPYGSVLVVDDVRSNIYVIKNMLRPYELNIDAATSGAEAIETIKAGNEYDIIFMDHMMPKMSGIEATKILRDMGYTGCIIALTANAIVGQDKIFLENGFDDYISKPIDTAELEDALIKYIRKEDM